MNIRINNQLVDVLDARCATRSCLSVGMDHGTFAPGRGYTRYQDQPRPVCMTRHVHGCPRAGVCEACRTVYVEAETRCRSCGAEVGEAAA